MLSRKGAPPAAQGQERPGSTWGADGHMGTQSCRGGKGGAVSCYRATALNTHLNGPTGHPGLCLCPHHNLPPGPAASPLLCRHRHLSALSLPLWGHANQHSQDLVGACIPGPRAPCPPAESVGLSAGLWGKLANTVVTGLIHSTIKGRVGMSGDCWR